MNRPMHVQLELDGGGQVLGRPVVMTAHYGENASLIAAVAALYVPEGGTVLDVTWGRGAFWRRTDLRRFALIGSDVLPAPGAEVIADFRALPYRSASADVVVLDPPYVPVTSSALRHIHRAYRNDQTESGTRVADTVELYRAGMAEAARVVRKGGTVWVKCQDIINGRQGHFMVVTVAELAAELALRAEDLFVLVQSSPPGRSTATSQDHARRNHSYLWVLRKPRRPA